MRPPLRLVGEAPGGRPGTPAAHNHVPLYPYPPGCAGDRLKGYTGYTVTQYIHGTQRQNIIPDRCPVGWPAAEARANAEVIFEDAKQAGQALVLVGARVKQAFRVEHQLFKIVDVHGVRLVCIPHPSGRNLAWNSQETRDAARQVFATFLPEIDKFLAHRLAQAK